MLDAPQDTVLFYLNKCREASHEISCRLLTWCEKSRGIKPGVSTVLQREYFAKEFSSEWWNNFTKECQPVIDSLARTTPKKEEIIKPAEQMKNPEYASILKEIFLTDQKIREKLATKEFDPNDTLWIKQMEIDVKNRTLLDSFKELYGFLTNDEVGIKGVESAWYVLQHSKDCEWNAKWIEYFIQHDLKGEVTERKLFLTIKRFYDPETGFCPKETRQKFIKYLQTTYSEKIAEKFGYQYFYK